MLTVYDIKSLIEPHTINHSLVSTTDCCMSLGSSGLEAVTK